MIFDREQLEQHETVILAPYGLRSANSQGRAYPEPESASRTAFQRDRDRIIHTTAFRRLEYKTQVFVFYEGDHFRTRLTHTLEVSQMARSVAQALRLNVDLTEAITLAHDLGHPPFGHAGEEMLNELMGAHGGFRHNAQGLRLVDTLEQRYPHDCGLNLTFETRRGLRKGEMPAGFPLAPDLRTDTPAPLEARVADLCDRAAYLSHDLDDAVFAGMIAASDLTGVGLWDQANAAVAARYGVVPAGREGVLLTVSEIIAASVRDLVATSDQALAGPTPQIAHSAHFAAALGELLQFLRVRFYKSARVLEKMDAGRRLIARLFERYTGDPACMPERTRARIPRDGLPRVVCDYIAGMTDRYAVRQADA